MKWTGQLVKYQEGISQIIANKFHKRLNQTHRLNPSQAIQLSRDLSEADNEMLTIDVSNEEIFEVVKQIIP